MVGETWSCEHCNSVETGKPAAIDEVAGYEGKIELWFCEGCV